MKRRRHRRSKTGAIARFSGAKVTVTNPRRRRRRRSTQHEGTTIFGYSTKDTFEAIEWAMKMIDPVKP